MVAVGCGLHYFISALVQSNFGTIDNTYLFSIPIKMWHTLKPGTPEHGTTKHGTAAKKWSTPEQWQNN